MTKITSSSSSPFSSDKILHRKKKSIFVCSGVRTSPEPSKALQPSSSSSPLVLLQARPESARFSEPARRLHRSASTRLRLGLRLPRPPPPLAEFADSQSPLFSSNDEPEFVIEVSTVSDKYQIFHDDIRLGP